MKLLRRHLIEKLPVSKVCEEADISPNLFYRWQEQWFVNGSLALEGKRRNEQTEEQERIEKLEKKIQQKDAVLAELMAEHVALKKELGEL
jgi:transposase